MPDISSLTLNQCSDVRVISKGALSQKALPNKMKTNRIFVELDFHHSRIDDETVIELVKLYRGSLQKLNLSACRMVSNVGYSAIAECSKLHQLVLTDARLQDSTVKRILVGAADLRHLDLSRNYELTEGGLRAVKDLKHLRSLSLEACLQTTTMRQEVMCSLGEVSTLRHLNLIRCEFNFRVLLNMARIGDLRSLEVLNLNMRFDLGCLVLIARSFARLRELRIGPISSVQGLDELHRLKQLRYLDLLYEQDTPFPDFVKDPAPLALKSLKIGCSMLFDYQLFYIAIHHSQLQSLSLQKCQQITDSGLEALLRREPHLRDLTLIGCSKLSYRIFQMLENLCLRLRCLHGAFYNLTEADVEKHRRAVHSLSEKRDLVYLPVSARRRDVGYSYCLKVRCPRHQDFGMPRMDTTWTKYWTNYYTDSNHLAPFDTMPVPR